ncbi:hypothetical protein [Burkholderia aenigmatica]|uniref:hypothetical protein n=1 Tax=Burkholderia aenigmatica TaxID=2015348 RepID=UPI00264D79FE|nr:hypothetical protein [Burkholderia aenigmatica]MDN7881243.1 hypothetical protein [Burkholderia aenigmatica]
MTTDQLTFAVEPYAQAIDEMRLLYPAHWAEIALNKDVIKLDPDYERYDALDRAGMVHVATARADGQLVGYHIFVLMTHLHYRQSYTATSDITYLRPQHRRGFNGMRFLRFAFESLKPLGVQRIYTNCKMHHDFGRVLERLGFVEAERIYTKVI